MMDKRAPIVIGIFLLIGAFVAYTQIPAVSTFITQTVLRRSPPPQIDLSELDPADVVDKDERQKKEQETLYGQTYIDDKRVTITKRQFIPSTITVPVGTTIIWTNKDTVKHAVVINNGAQTPDLLPEGEGAIIFQKPGTYTYYDRTNTEITGAVIVE